MEHLSPKQVEDYSQQQMHASELLAVGDHLEVCEACRRHVESAMNGDSTFFALHTEAFAENGNLSAHLTDEQAADYVDKNLSGESLQMVSDHLSNCEQCVFAVEDLRAFRNEIAPSLDREYRPATAVPPVQIKSGWRERFASLFRVSPVPAFGGAALAVLLVAVIAWLVWRTPGERDPQIAVAPTPSSQPSPTVATPSPQPTEPERVVVAELNDGGRVLTLDQEGKLSGVDDLPPGYQNLLAKALSTQRIEKSSQLQGLTRPPSSLMGTDDPADRFVVLSPAGTVLLTEKPAFRWSTMEGATGYVVEVYDDQFKQVATSPQLTDTSWTTTLARGQVYSWQVKALKDGQEFTSPRPPAPQAKFRILDQAKANEIARARRAHANSHLTLALLYADAGLMQEAEQELRLVRRANPNSPIARALLRSLQSQR
ncbi:MAG TPA: tetratricopeptide repeat protein [Pyrinomonadaceae bacterium]|nr:tetratricopeptide repeat protein [Pyrinomonadaceae bacterium]